MSTPPSLEIDRSAALHSLLLNLALKEAISDEVLTDALALLKRPLEHYTVTDYKRTQLLDDLLAGHLTAEGFMRAWRQARVHAVASSPAYPIPRHSKPTPNKTPALIVGLALILAAFAVAAYWAHIQRQKQFAIQPPEKAADTGILQAMPEAVPNTVDTPIPNRLTPAGTIDYKQQYVADGINLASMAKTAVAEYYASMAKYPSNNAEVGLPAPTDLRGDAVDSVSVTENGVITIQYNHLVGDNPTLIFIPNSISNGPIFWDCKTGTLPAEYRPPHCQ